MSNHVSYAFARKLESRDVTVAEWVVMRELYGEDALAPSRLADKLRLTRGAISKLSERLIVKGFVMRAPDVSDGRAHTLALTTKGRSLIPKLAALADQNDAEFFDHLTAQERATVERILKQIVEIRGLKSIPVD
ncbi:MAG TPA: MarR family transcriptional regulator [Steroidobacteraceae bacterium]|nr:MarR family transcriptional regulator [Steroidobacteraceae bacterium]